MIRCSVCGRENEDTFRFCLDCGSELKVPAPRDPAEPAPIPLTELAPPTGVMPMASAVTAPAPPSVSSATPPAGSPRAPSSATPGAGAPPPTPVAPPAPVSVAPAPGPTPGPATPERPIPDHPRPCPVCGHEVAAGHRFCGACGARADGPAPPPQPAAATAAAATAGGTQVMGMAQAPELLAPRFKVTVVAPDGSEVQTVVLQGSETVVGGEGASLVIPGDPFVGAHHLTLVEHAGVLKVRDAGSETGTFLKVDAGHPVPLGPGSALRLGRQRLRLDPVPPLSEVPAAPDGTQAWGSPDGGARWRLVQELEGGGDGAAFLLAEGSTLIGREEGDLTFPDDGYVSGRHGRIEVGADGRATYEDLGSSNGTFLRLTQETVVSEGDFLLVGSHLLRIDLQ